jgi:hypothetical protein
MALALWQLNQWLSAVGFEPSAGGAILRLSARNPLVVGGQHDARHPHSRRAQLRTRIARILLVADARSCWVS